MAVVIFNARAILPDKILDGAAIFIDNGVIKSVWRPRGKFRECARGCVRIDAKRNFVSAGFIDTHIHGLPDKIFEKEARFGTTSILPTLSCQSLESLERSVNKIKKFIQTNPPGKSVLGIRLEGPFLNPVKAGAQNKKYILKPAAGALERIIKICGRLLKVMTIAPEIKGGLAIVKTLRRKGIIASIGHSDADYEEALSGIGAGITHATHTFNAMSPLERRSPGVAGAVLEADNVSAEIILDLVHVHKSLFKLLVATKGPDRVILVTDSVACEVPPGSGFREGAWRLKGGRLAGSALTMNRAVRNAMRAGGLSLHEAVRLATVNPAIALGVYEKKGSLEAGKDADIVMFNEKLDVKLTIISGNVVSTFVST